MFSPIYLPEKGVNKFNSTNLLEFGKRYGIFSSCMSLFKSVKARDTDDVVKLLLFISSFNIRITETNYVGIVLRKLGVRVLDLTSLGFEVDNTSGEWALFDCCSNKGIVDEYIRTGEIRSSLTKVFEKYYKLVRGR